MTNWKISKFVAQNKRIFSESGEGVYQLHIELEWKNLAFDLLSEIADLKVLYKFLKDIAGKKKILHIVAFNNEDI